MAAMQFWGAEVKSKEPLRVEVEAETFVHVSQVTLGDMKKVTEAVTLHVETCGKKLVMGILSQTTPQLQLDLVFDEDFTISHSGKSGSIHLLGYQSLGPMSDSDVEDSSDDEEEAIPIAKENGKPAAAPALTAPAAKPKADKAKPAEQDESDDDDDDSEDDEDDSDEEGDSDIEGMAIDSGSEDDSEDDSEDSEEETPAKVADSGKKRPNADAKTPPQTKKAKIATPQKTDGKKGAAAPGTPHPNKKIVKTPGGDETPKSAGADVSCGSCKKTFKSETALQSHNAAKHSAAK